MFPSKRESHPIRGGSCVAIHLDTHWGHDYAYTPDRGTFQGKAQKRVCDSEQPAWLPVGLRCAGQGRGQCFGPLSLAVKRVHVRVGIALTRSRTLRDRAFDVRKVPLRQGNLKRAERFGEPIATARAD